MGACLSCALGDAPHKPGYGYGGDVVKREVANPTIHDALQLHAPEEPKEEAPKDSTTSSPPRGKLVKPAQPSAPPSIPLPPTPQQPQQPTVVQQSPAVYAPQAQRIPQVATFEMNSRTSPPNFNPYTQPLPQASQSQAPQSHAPYSGYSGSDQPDAALAIISAYDDQPMPNRGGMGGNGRGYGRGGMPPRQNSRTDGYGGPGNGGMRPMNDGRGPPPQNQQGYAPPPLLAGDQRPSSRQGGRGYGPPPLGGDPRSNPRHGGQGSRGGYGPPPFAGDQRPSSRQGGRGGPPPFAADQRPSSRQGGRGGPQYRGGQGGYGPNGGGRDPPPQQQMQYPPQQRRPVPQARGYGGPGYTAELQ